MSAQPVHQEPDPRDPQVILDRLPEREREFFLSQYRQHAQAAVDDLAGYNRLQRFLHMWGIRARALEQALAANPGYYEELDAQIAGIRDGSIPTTPIEEALAQVLGMSIEDAAAYWQGKIVEARLSRQSR